MKSRWYCLLTFLMVSHFLYAENDTVLKLKEEVTISTKYVRIVDIIESSADESAKSPISSIHLGLAPEGTIVRVITADEVLSEIKRRDSNLKFIVIGDCVKVTSLKPISKENESDKMTKAVVAIKPIYPGRILTTADITLKNMAIESSEVDYFTDISILVGSISTANIEKGEIIRLGLLRLKPVVKNRDTVRARGKFIEANAVALQDGAIGDVIKLEYPATKIKFMGKVISSTVVSVVNEEGR